MNGIQLLQVIHRVALYIHSRAPDIQTYEDWGKLRRELMHDDLPLTKKHPIHLEWVPPFHPYRMVINSILMDIWMGIRSNQPWAWVHGGMLDLIKQEQREQEMYPFGKEWIAGE